MKKINKMSNLLIWGSLFLFVLSAIGFFVPFLTPPKNLSAPGKTTFSEFLADISFFLFFAGSLFILIDTFFSKHETK